MLFIVFVEFIIFTALGNELFQQFGISDDLDIHVGINISLSIFLSFWPSHYIFVWVFPELSAQADANAEKRLKESSRSKTYGFANSRA